MLSLHSYFRSSAAYRVRIALALKALEWQIIPVNLLKAEQLSDQYLQQNPQGLVPMLVEKSQTISQSLAIIEYLEEQYPEPSLLAIDALARAQIRSLAYQIAMDIHPLNNLRVLKYLQGQYGLTIEQKTQWYRHWIDQGFAAFEASLASHVCSGQFCVGNRVSLADVCLIPQVYNAKRFGCDLAAYPLIMSIARHCNSLAAFTETHPEQQVDSQ